MTRAGRGRPRPILFAGWEVGTYGCPMVKRTSLSEEVLSFHGEFREQGPSSGAWELCYAHFGRNPEADTEKASLHLAAFLASWGMMRGSSFLRNHSFVVHESIVRLIVGGKHGIARNLHARDLASQQDEILKLVGKLCKHYRAYHPKRRNPTTVLTSKILLATLGCSIGYDRYVVAGLRHEGIAAQLSRRGLMQLNGWAQERLGELDDLQKTFRAKGLDYPHMKLLDMYFWRIGRRSLNIQQPAATERKRDLS